MTTMIDYRAKAEAFADKQAAIKPMTPAEYMNTVREAEAMFRAADGDTGSTTGNAPELACDPKTAIKERTVTCVVCGKSFKILTAAHLNSHNHTAESYRELCGYKKGTPLICKALQRDRRKQMADMKLWERPGSGAMKNKEAAAKAAAASTAAAKTGTSAPVAPAPAAPAAAPKPVEKPADKPANGNK